MQTPLHIRPANHSDAAAVCDLLRDSILESCIQDHKNDSAILGAWLGNKNADIVGAWLVSPSNYALVAEASGKIVGIGLLTSKGKIALLYVSPGMQQAGIGKRLLSALEEQACAWRLPVVQIASTITARSFFLQLHYSEQGQASSCFGIQTSLLGKQIAFKSHSPQRLSGRCKCSAET
jgi:GNAT superfamily N-acetyltransferase